MKEKTKYIFPLLFLSTIIMVVSIREQKAEWKGKIEVENGVKFIKNPKEPIYSEDVFILEEELSIGKADGKDEYMFTRLWYLAVDDNENIYAMDQGETHVKVYNKNGTFLKSIGRRGEGEKDLVSCFILIKYS